MGVEYTKSILKQKEINKTKSLPRQRKCPNGCRGKEIRASALISSKTFSPGPCYGPGLKGVCPARSAAPTWTPLAPARKRPGAKDFTFSPAWLDRG